MNNFKIRVVENIGRHSDFTFGKVGDVLEVINGVLIDANGFKLGLSPLKSIDEIHDFIYDSDIDTKFEFIEEIKLYKNYELMQLIHEQYDSMENKKFKIVDISKGEVYVPCCAKRLGEGDVIHVNMFQERNIKGLFDKYEKIVYLVGEVLFQEVDNKKHQTQKKIKELEKSAQKINDQIKDLEQELKRG